MNKRRFLPAALAAAVAAALLLTGCAKSGTGGAKAVETSAERGPKKVRIAYYGGTCEAPIYRAQEKALFAKYGLEAELVKVDFDTLKEGVATGKIDAVQVTAGELKPVEQGLDIKYTRGVHTGCIQAVVPASSPIAEAGGLKGKRIGVEAIGGVPMTLLSIELGAKGIDPKSGVTWKAFPAPQLEQALAKGEIDAFVTWDPFGQLAIDSGKVKRVFSNTYSAPYKDKYCCFVGVNGKLAERDPATVKSITSALAEAAEDIEADPSGTAQLAVGGKYTAGDVKTIGFLLGEYGFKPGGEPAGDKTRASLAFWLGNMKKQGILDASTDPDALLRSVYLPQK